MKTELKRVSVSFLALLFLQVRKELAAVLVFESHAKAGTVCECDSSADVWARPVWVELHTHTHSFIVKLNRSAYLMKYTDVRKCPS